MVSSIENIREFVLQVEKTLAARRLYHPTSAAFREANERLYEKCRGAAGADGFTLGFGSTDLYVDKASVLNRPKREESYFFPLYRDGLRELTFTPQVTQADLNGLLSALEIKDRDLGPGDDMVNHLWRRDLTTITHSAIDGIGESEDGGEGGANELHGLIAELADKIKNPAAPTVGQSYAFVLDADMKVAAQDLHYDATTMRRTFEENPAVLRLSDEQAAQLRAELGEDRDQILVERFIEILLVIVRSPGKSIDGAALAPVFQQLADAYWNAHDYARVAAILTPVRAAASEAPTPEQRAAMADVVRRFVTPERLNIILLDFVGGALAPQIAMRFWDFVPDESIWPILLDAWSRLPEGETRTLVLNALRTRLARNLDLLRQTLASPEPARIRAALALLDAKTEKIFINDLIRLAEHPEESIRIKGLAAAARVGGPGGFEVLWKAMESDPSKSVRLYAFRAASTTQWPGFAPRLQALVTDSQFAQRPAWEREKYVRLLGAIAGPQAQPLFESWIPSKRWLWQTKDLEMLELALRGLGSTGASGLERVRALAAGGGKPAEVARKVLESLSAEGGLEGKRTLAGSSKP